MTSIPVHPDNTPERFILHLNEEYEIYRDYKTEYHNDNIHNPRYLLYKKINPPPMESFRDFVHSRFFGDNKNMNIFHMSIVINFDLSVESIYSITPDDETRRKGILLNAIIKKFLADYEVEFEYYDQNNHINNQISRSYHPGRRYGSGQYGDEAKEKRFQDFVMKRFFGELDKVNIPPVDKEESSKYSFDALQNDA